MTVADVEARLASALAPTRSAAPVLTHIVRYPVKSCRGQEVSSAVVEPWGLAGDRRWMLVDGSGSTVTAREVPRLVLVVPEITETGLLLKAPAQQPLIVEVPQAGRLVQVSIWDDVLDASPAAAEASAWFARVTGRAVTLVYLDDPRRRATDPRWTRPGDVVSFADGFPLLLASESSLAALNDWIAGGAHASDGPLPMRRFRPNLVVSGAPAWDEDRWRRLRIGETTFRAVKACERCVLTMIDPETAQKSKEPLYTLARHRQWDHKTWFALNLVAEQAGGTLRPGDEVKVLERSDHPEPQR